MSSFTVNNSPFVFLGIERRLSSDFITEEAPLFMKIPLRKAAGLLLSQTETLLSMFTETHHFPYLRQETSRCRFTSKSLCNV